MTPLEIGRIAWRLWKLRTLERAEFQRLLAIEGEIVWFMAVTGWDRPAAARRVFQLGGVGATQRHCRAEYFTRNKAEAPNP